mgnify:CR=1 FL=1
MKAIYRRHKIHRRRRPPCKRQKRKMMLSILFACSVAVFSLLFLLLILYCDGEADIPENGTIVEVAESQIGNDGDTYWNWYGFDQHVDWCACFVSWCAERCGYIKGGKAPKFADCREGVEWFIANKQWKGERVMPKAGMIVFFDWDASGDADHAGIVKACKDGVIYTIEGNSGGRCRERKYPVGSDEIYGYGVIG